MKIKMNDWISSIIKDKRKRALPVMTYPGLEFTGKNISDIVTNGQNHFECIAALAEKYPNAGTVIVMDLSVEAEAFGSKILFGKDEVPTITAPLVTSADEINNLKVPSVGDGRSGEYLKAAALAAGNINDRPVFGGMIGPYSLAGRLFDMTEMMTFVLMEPDAAHQLLDKSKEFLKEYALGFKKAGANGIVLAEPAAGLLSAEMCHMFSSFYVKEIVDYVQDDSFMVILHNCGNTNEQVETMVSTGAMGLHFGDAVDMMDVLPQVPESVLALGNISPSHVFLNGSPSVMRNEVLSLLEKTSSYNNFVLSSGCDVPPGAPVENIEAFYQALEEFNGR
ncbi:MAG: uroporphyrinogen decarboxylase family protein [Bacteroidota bacterium]